MASVRAMRLLNALASGTLTGAQLDTLLADPTRLADFKSLFLLPGQSRRIWLSEVLMSAVAASSTAMSAVAASSTAMTTIAASSEARAAVIASSEAMAAVNANDQAARILMLAGTGQNYANFANVAAVAASSTAMTAVAASHVAMTAVAASSVAMAAVIASSTAMTAVAASSTAMTAVAASSVAKLALYESDTALTACFNSATAMTALRDAATIYSKAGSGSVQVSLTSGTTPSDLVNTGKYLLLGVSGFTTTARTILVSTRRSGSTRPSSISNAGHESPAATAGALLCCPITGPLSFSGSSSGTSLTYLSLLRCDV